MQRMLSDDRWSIVKHLDSYFPRSPIASVAGQHAGAADLSAYVHDINDIQQIDKLGSKS